MCAWKGLVREVLRKGSWSDEDVEAGRKGPGRGGSKHHLSHQRQLLNSQCARSGQEAGGHAGRVLVPAGLGQKCRPALRNSTWTDDH